MTTRKSRKPAPMKPALDALKASTAPVAPAPTTAPDDAFAGMTCQRAAEAFLAAKSKPAKDALVAFIRKRAAQSARKRWAHLLAAVEANDANRVRYHAATGDDKREAAKALAPKAEAKPAKVAAKTPAKGAPAKPDDAVVALAAAIGVPVEKVAAMAAFLRMGA